MRLLTYVRTGLRYLSILVLVSLLLLFSSPPSYASYSKAASGKYDKYFKRYSIRYVPEYSWKWIKAQALQESLLDRRAVSSAGAMGVMQIMPGTWRDETDRLGIIASPYNAKVNIQVGTSYMRRMVRFWKAPRTRFQRLQLAQASYNAGAGNILRAQNKCPGRSWYTIKRCLHRVTGHRNAQSTRAYVARISSWYGKLTREGE
jgi:soluble lytic murein transglycosylase-like protein